MRYEPQDIVLSLRKREEKGKGITRQRERDGKKERERGEKRREEAKEAEKKRARDIRQVDGLRVSLSQPSILRVTSGSAAGP